MSWALFWLAAFVVAFGAFTLISLVIAIPALFAYSYLSTRIKDVVSSIETFIDEFIAKMAEHHKETN